jgi:hypothetical protein
MKVKLLRDAKIRHAAGEIVEVSPAECQFLTSLGSAVIVDAAPATAKAEQKPAAKTTKKK